MRNHVGDILAALDRRSEEVNVLACGAVDVGSVRIKRRQGRGRTDPTVEMIFTTLDEHLRERIIGDTRLLGVKPSSATGRGYVSLTSPHLLNDQLTGR